MTASEQRLHPFSVLFDLARYARIFLWPALLAYFGSGGGPRLPGRYGFDPSGLETWLWVLLVPSAALSIVRYLTFRIDYGPDELVIRSGLLFRNVRHLPYARIQNLDAVQNVVHRALGVVDVHIETGSGGGAPEARLSVLPAAALEEMRARVFAGREPRGAEAGTAADVADPAPVTLLLRLTLRDLLLLGVIENKGLVLVGAAYGLLWETGVMDRLWAVLFAGTLDTSGLFREVFGFLVGRGPLPLGRLALALGVVAGFLVAVRIVSMAWAVIRLWDFRLTRSGDDVRVSYGLFTRVTATIPLGRVQTVTVRRAWLARRLGRASIRVETAGGRAGEATRDREWLAPLVRESLVPQLLDEIVPGLTSAAGDWQAVHPRAFRRAIKPAMLAAFVPSAIVVGAFGWRVVPIALLLVAWTAWSTRQQVRHLAWYVSETLVAFRSGWLSRAETMVRVSRVQAVGLGESLFDRRAGMASVLVDTAGAGEWSHRVHVPYLDAAVARDIQQRLARTAARFAFRW